MVNDAMDPLPFSPAAERNKAPILEVLRRLLPARACVLEIASGTGQHAAHCAAAQPGWAWQPSEADPQALEVVALRCAALPNVRPPVVLDVMADDWPVAPASHDALYCANLLHISPWETCAALMRGAARALRPGGLLLLYGPYRVDGMPTAPGNLAFDADLRARDARWGVRRLAEVQAEAAVAGLVLDEQVDMPANNLMLVMHLSAAAPASAAGRAA